MRVGGVGGWVGVLGLCVVNSEICNACRGGCQSLAPLPSFFPPLAGTLDQGNGLLEVWEQGAKEEVFPLVLGAFESLGRSVEHLQDRSIKLVAAS